MVRRIIYIVFLATLVGAIGYFYFQFQHKKTGTLQEYSFASIPGDAGFVVKVNDLSALSDLAKSENPLIRSIQNIPLVQEWIEDLFLLDSLAKKMPDNIRLFYESNVVVSWHYKTEEKARVLITLNLKQKEISKELLANGKDVWKNIEVLKKIGQTTIYKWNPPGSKNAMYVYRRDNQVLLSASLDLLETSLHSIENKNGLANQVVFTHLEATADENAGFNLFLNLKEIGANAAKFSTASEVDELTEVKRLGEWMELDFKLADNGILLNGFGVEQDSLNYFNLLKQQEPVAQQAHYILPVSVKDYTFYGFSDMPVFRRNYTAYRENGVHGAEYPLSLNRIAKKTGVQPDQFFDDLIYEEICMVKDAGISSDEDVNRLVLMKVLSEREAEDKYKNFLQEYAERKKEDIRSFIHELRPDNRTVYNVYDYPFENALSLLYGRHIDDVRLRYICFYDNYMVLGANEKVLNKFVLENMRNRTLANDPRFKTFFENFSDYSNYFRFKRMRGWENVIADNATHELATKVLGNTKYWEDYYAMGLQMQAVNDLIYSNVFLNYAPDLEDKPQTVWESRLDTIAIMKPALVQNHNTQEKEIVVQDAANNLYLMSSSGVVLWKKKLDNPILGTIHQVDYFKNGKLQLLFNTKSKIYILDRNGNYVERYPINLSSEATTGLSVFDYDRKRDYRIFLPCADRKVYLYDKRGNKNTGWKFTRTDHLVKRPVQYFRVGNRDFIVFKDKTRIYILDRRGNTRVKLKKQFVPSIQNDLYLDKNPNEGKARWVTTSTDGTLQYIYTDGTVKEKKMPNVSTNHYYLFEDLNGSRYGEHIFVSENRLDVYNTNGEMIYQYQFENNIQLSPSTYRFGTGDIKLGVVDAKAGRLFLFSNDGSMYDGFPLRGQTEFSIGFLNQSGFNLVAGGANSYLLNYRVK